MTKRNPLRTPDAELQKRIKEAGELFARLRGASYGFRFSTFDRGGPPPSIVGFYVERRSDGTERSVIDTDPYPTRREARLCLLHALLFEVEIRRLEETTCLIFHYDTKALTLPGLCAT